MDKQYYTIREVANLLGCNPITVRQRIKEGAFPGAVKVAGDNGKEWRIPVGEIEKAVTVTTEPASPLPTGIVTEQGVKRLFEEHIKFTRQVIEETAKQTAEQIAATVASQVSHDLVEIAKNQAIENAELRKEFTKVKNMLMVKEALNKEKKPWWKRFSK